MKTILLYWQARQTKHHHFTPGRNQEEPAQRAVQAVRSPQCPAQYGTDKPSMRFLNFF
jgi:hypothetical protein